MNFSTLAPPCDTTTMAWNAPSLVSGIPPLHEEIINIKGVLEREHRSRSGLELGFRQGLGRGSNGETYIASEGPAVVAVGHARNDWRGARQETDGEVRLEGGRARDEVDEQPEEDGCTLPPSYCSHDLET